ncbi:creatininase family protein [Limobrevibacterium gyesilva]|uniref:Creatininase family protein n=1 Tax=Limobrevibacterium gyesilva TaxID=2991712 RepID=A0AA41YVB7_9PROT|nr:creatininase family protein [Limobrevibacterium gyesilva]MCW3477203.1 creatininase family protein [Limobrevibacterium gyesilva]
MTPEIDWTRLTGPDIRAVAARGNALAVLPVGSLEQHGPHLPVITDTRTAWEIAIRAARLAAADTPVLVLPGMWTGMSEHHLPFGGTISLNFNEFRAVLTGVVRSLRAIGFARLLIVNGHGGNVEPLAVAARELAHEFGLPVVATTPWYIVADEILALMETGTGPQHACEAETSVMLAMTPDTVRTDKLEEAVRQAPPAIPGRPGFSRFWSFSERAPVTGTKGDPRPATAEKGEKMLNTMAAALADAMHDPTLWRTPDPVWSPGRGQGNTAGSALD